MKFIASNYDKETGISTVVIEHMNTTFEGIAKLHPEDENVASEIVGGTYAEIRATIKALKYERKVEKEKCEECRRFLKACECYKDFDKESPTASTLYRQLNKRIDNVNDITQEINELILLLRGSIIKRDCILKALNKSKEIKEQ